MHEWMKWAQLSRDARCPVPLNSDGRAAYGRRCRRETSSFLAVQARLLNSENEQATGADLPWGRDTKEVPDELPCSARSALLIARAYLAEHDPH